MFTNGFRSNGKNAAPGMKGVVKFGSLIKLHQVYVKGALSGY
jgi:hypothetical protein